MPVGALAVPGLALARRVQAPVVAWSGRACPRSSFHPVERSFLALVGPIFSAEGEVLLVTASALVAESQEQAQAAAWKAAAYPTFLCTSPVGQCFLFALALSSKGLAHSRGAPKLAAGAGIRDSTSGNVAP